MKMGPGGQSPRTGGGIPTNHHHSDISLLIAVYRVLSARYVLNNFKGIPLLP